MTRAEEAIRATTRAIAATVRDVPPLDLEPAPGELWSPARGRRRARRVRSGPRLPSWIAPLAAAAVVVAVAVSLVFIRGNPNRSVVPQLTPTTTAPADAVPRYYAALDPLTGKSGPVRGLLVGDTITGKTLAVIPPPAHMSYASVSAAADDRTFVAFAAGTGASWLKGRWYQLHLAPGTAHPVSVTATAIPTQSFVAASALSGSGKYLAVDENGPTEGKTKGLQRIIVFSVATGRPVRDWSARDDASSSSFVSLSWFDGDQAIAFSANNMLPDKMTVRRLNVGGPQGDGDLIADSQLIWSAPLSTNPMLPLVSADGQTIAYATDDFADRFTVRPTDRPAGHNQGRTTITWHVYRVSAQTPAAGKDTIAYQATGSPQGILEVMANSTLWVSPSGSAVIGAWYASPGSPSRGSAYFGVMSHGTFTPLRLPRELSGQIIAW
jgi:hypothetical protein